MKLIKNLILIKLFLNIFQFCLNSKLLKAAIKRNRRNFKSDLDLENDIYPHRLFLAKKIRTLISQTPEGENKPSPSAENSTSSNNSSNLTRLSASLYDDLNKTFVVQNLHTFKKRRKLLDFKLLDKQIELIFQSMLYSQRNSASSLRGYIQIFINNFEECDKDIDNVLSLDEFSSCMQNDTYLKKILIPDKIVSAQTNFTNSSYFYQILFDLFDEYNHNYLNFNDYMKLRLMIFSWKHCSLATTYIEETLFECAFEVAAGFKTLNSRSARNIFNLGLYLSNNEVIRNLDFISYCMITVSANLYSYINTKDDGDISKSELNTALDNNMLPIRYNQFTINALFWLSKEGRVNKGIDMKTFIFYDYILKIFNMKNATRPYYLNQTEFVGVLNNAFFPNKTLNEIYKIPPFDLTSASFNMLAYLNISRYMNEDDYLMTFLQIKDKKKNSNFHSNHARKYAKFKRQENNSSDNSSNTTAAMFNLTKTAGFLFNILDFDADGYISFKEFGCLIQISFIMSQIDKNKIGMVPAGILYDYLYNYDDFPRISDKLKKRIGRLTSIPEDLYINLYSLIILLKSDEAMELYSRKLNLNTIYEVELKTVLYKMGLKAFPDNFLNKCLRGTDEEFLPKYDWECAIIEAVISISKYYQSVRFYQMTKANNITLLNTIFINVDPQVKG